VNSKQCSHSRFYVPALPLSLHAWPRVRGYIFHRQSEQQRKPTRHRQGIARDTRLFSRFLVTPFPVCSASGCSYFRTHLHRTQRTNPNLSRWCRASRTISFSGAQRDGVGAYFPDSHIWVRSRCEDEATQVKHDFYAPSCLVLSEVMHAITTRSRASKELSPHSTPTGFISGDVCHCQWPTSALCTDRSGIRIALHHTQVRWTVTSRVNAWRFHLPCLLSTCHCGWFYVCSLPLSFPSR